MKISEAFRKRFQELLKEKQTTIFKFTKANGIPRSTVTNLLAGNSKSPTLSTLYQISDGFGITVLEFLNCDLFTAENLELE